MNDLAIIDSLCGVTKTSLIFKKDVTKNEWLNVFNSLQKIEGCVQFWLGDCLAYKEQKWGMYEDVADTTGISAITLRQYKQVAEAIKSDERSSDLTYEHHRQVVSLEPEQQKELLQKASDEHLTTRELRKEVKNIKDLQKEKIELPEGKYQVIYADPPWPVESMVLDKWESPLGDKYETMTIEQIKQMKVNELAFDDCSLFLWTTHTFLKESFDIIESWGFKYHCCITWDKGNGWSLCGFHRRTEFCLYAYKGKINVNQEGKFIPTLIQELKGKHSEKPLIMDDLIRSNTPEPRIELFARKEKEGFKSWGNQI